MSVRSDLMTRARSLLMRTNGGSGVLYRAKDAESTQGSGQSLNYVSCSEETDEDYDAPDGMRTRKVRTCKLVVDPTSEHYCGISSVSIRGVFVIGGVDYAVMSITSYSAGIVDVKVRNTTSVEISRPRMRGIER